MKAPHRRPGWTRLSLPGSKTSQRWVHDASGWHVEHCGHPTANWPYVVLDAEGRLRAASNGRCHRTLRDAFDFVEARYLEARARYLEARAAKAGRVVVGRLAVDGTIEVCR